MIKCIAVDFDNTIAYPKGGKIRLFRMLRAYGFSLKNLREIYERSKNEGGLSADNLIRIAQTYIDVELDAQKIRQDIDDWLRSSVTCYPDALAALTTWKQAKIPVVIVTVGSPEFQKRKIEISGVPYDQVFVLSEINRKSKTILSLVEKYGSCVFIDDKATELDAIRESGIRSEDVATFRIHRKNGPYRRQKSLYEHTDISRLDDKVLLAHFR
jgi:FMN phosphatase YigB (HAD superfamily)